MKTYVQPGEHLTLTATAAATAGQLVKVGAIVGVAQNDAAIGDSLTLVRRGVFEVTKTSAEAWTVGAKVFLDETAGSVTVVDTDNTLIGVATAAAANPSSSGEVLLDGVIR
ncbi:DUF2190 family protein [Thioclava kandeliae]|uniref:DUF2190 family protein n=1 Tax=Thioclava kandeliae TaxID=3070818 RepID=A0ABV1SID8_9RHOB